MPREHKRDSKERRWKPYATTYDPIKVGSIDGTDEVPHDNAIIRACHSQYIPDKDLAGKPKNTLFVGRLHPRVTDDELNDIFSEYGRLKRCCVVRDLVTGCSKRYAFVEYEKERHADRAYRHAHKSIIRGVEILVDWEVSRTMRGWKPRSLGGGFGGKRESGQLRFGCRDRPWKEPIKVER